MLFEEFQTHAHASTNLQLGSPPSDMDSLKVIAFGAKVTATASSKYMLSTKVTASTGSLTLADEVVMGLPALCGDLHKRLSLSLEEAALSIFKTLLAREQVDESVSPWFPDWLKNDLVSTGGPLDNLAQCVAILLKKGTDIPESLPEDADLQAINVAFKDYLRLNGLGRHSVQELAQEGSEVAVKLFTFLDSVDVAMASLVSKFPVPRDLESNGLRPVISAAAEWNVDAIKVLLQLETVDQNIKALWDDNIATSAEMSKLEPLMPYKSGANCSQACKTSLNSLMDLHAKGMESWMADYQYFLLPR
jgi:hypothetical protein